MRKKKKKKKKNPEKKTEKSIAMTYREHVVIGASMKLWSAARTTTQSLLFARINRADVNLIAFVVENRFLESKLAIVGTVCVRCH
jgi:hypothetical protein